MSNINFDLACYIKDHGITRAHIARKTNISEVKIGAALKNTRKLSADEFLAICDALSVAPSNIKDYHLRRTG